MVYRWSAIVLIALVMSVNPACDDEEGGEVSVEPTPRVPGIRAPDGEKRIEEIEVYDDRVEPRQVNITASAPTEVQVANRSREECVFFIGDYLTGLRVRPGETTKMGVTVPEGRSGETVSMGCAGDEDRRGSAVIEFKGVLPGAGR